MKKIIYSVVLITLFPVWCFASSSEIQINEAKKLKAYEMGTKAAREAENNRRLWKEGKGDPEMAKQYQEGLEFAKKAQEEHERLYQQAKENIEKQQSRSISVVGYGVRVKPQHKNNVS